jgi:cytochrome d ubiquinol oxidase subunit I
MVAILAPLQLFIGDQHGLNTAEHQPAKLAAMEAHWDGSHPAGLVLFAVPNESEERNDFEISIPNIASLIITHDSQGLFKGMKDFKPEDRPPVKPVFYAFRLMVGIGLLMIAIGLVGAFLWLRGRLFDERLYLAAVQHAWPLGFIAILSGWWVTETGRQPWIATGILRTIDAVSPVTFGAVLTSLILFVLVYTSVFSMGIYYINRLIEKGPMGASIEPEDSVPSRPMSAAAEAAHDATEGAR